MIVIFAFVRSGSTGLLHILQNHRDIKLANEPFLRFKFPNFETALSHVYENFTGFKTLADQLSEEYNRYILTNPDFKVIFLYRENLLDSAISLEVGKQTNIGNIHSRETHLGSINDIDKLYNTEIQPLDVNTIESHIEDYYNNIKYYQDIIYKYCNDFFEITYEELYNSPKREKWNIIEKIFHFLELEVPGERRKNIEGLFSSDRKVTNKDIYNNIPNIREIEEHFKNRNTKLE